MGIGNAFFSTKSFDWGIGKFHDEIIIRLKVGAFKQTGANSHRILGLGCKGNPD